MRHPAKEGNAFIARACRCRVSSIAMNTAMAADSQQPHALGSGNQRRRPLKAGTTCQRHGSPHKRVSCPRIRMAWTDGRDEGVETAQIAFFSDNKQVEARQRLCSRSSRGGIWRCGCCHSAVVILCC